MGFRLTTPYKSSLYFRIKAHASKQIVAQIVRPAACVQIPPDELVFSKKHLASGNWLNQCGFAHQRRSGNKALHGGQQTIDSLGVWPAGRNEVPLQIS